MNSILKDNISYIQDIVMFFFPSYCFICGERLEIHSDVLCESCASSMKRKNQISCLFCKKEINDISQKCCSDSPLDFIFSIGDYKDKWGNLIESFKLQQKTSLKEFLGNEMANALLNNDIFKSYDYLLPVPTHNLKKRERGFSQTLLLANVIAKRVDTPLLIGPVKRVNFKRSQIGLSAKERKLNVVNTFSVDETKFPKGKKILILDDVLTTGSTLKELGTILKNAGANKVSALVLAKA